VINLLKSLKMFIKKIFAKRIFLNPFKTQFEIKAPRRTGKTTACVKFAKRMIKKNNTVIWIIHHNYYKGVIRACLPIEYFSKIVFYIEEGTERYLTDIIHSEQLCGRVKAEDKNAFIVDEANCLAKNTIPNIIRNFCKQHDTPYIITQTPFYYLQEKGSDCGTVEVIGSYDIKRGNIRYEK
jgi:hypothetical protein